MYETCRAVDILSIFTDLGLSFGTMSGTKNRLFDIKSSHDFCRYKNTIQIIYFHINAPASGMRWLSRMFIDAEIYNILQYMKFNMLLNGHKSAALHFNNKYHGMSRHIVG